MNTKELRLHPATEHARCQSEILLAKKGGIRHVRRQITELLKQLDPFLTSLKRLTPVDERKARIIRSVAGGIELTKQRDAIDYYLIRRIKRALTGAYGALSESPQNIRDAIEKMIRWYRLPWYSNLDDPMNLDREYGIGDSVSYWFIEEVHNVIEVLNEYCETGKRKTQPRTGVKRTNELNRLIENRILDYEKRYGGSYRTIATALTDEGIEVSHSTVGRVLIKLRRRKGNPKRSFPGKGEWEGLSSEAAPDYIEAFTMPDD